MKFTDINVQQTIDKYIAENPFLDITQKQIEKVKEIYHKVENEQGVLKKTFSEHQDVVTGIFSDVIRGEDDVVMFDRWADNKHMTYFDIFLRKGERENITKAINTAGLSTEFLKPVRKLQEYGNTTINEKGQAVRITQEIDVDDDGYKYVSKFAIYLDGETVYEYNAGKSFIKERAENKFIENAQEIYDVTGEFYIRETIASRRITTQNYEYIQEAYANKNGDVLTRRRYAAGTIIKGVKVGGRFVK